MLPVEGGLLTADAARVTLFELRAGRYHLAWFQSHDRQIWQCSNRSLQPEELYCAARLLAIIDLLLKKGVCNYVSPPPLNSQILWSWSGDLGVLKEKSPCVFFSGFKKHHQGWLTLSHTPNKCEQHGRVKDFSTSLDTKQSTILQQL